MAISAGTQWLYPASIGALHTLRERMHWSQSRKWSGVSTAGTGLLSLVSLPGLIAPAFENVGARLVRYLKNRQRVVRVLIVPVKEMFGVEYHTPALGAEVCHGFTDDGEIVVEADAQHLPDVGW